MQWFRALPPGTQDRLVGLSLLIPSGAVLATAMWLEPDPTGVGTHRQLGLGGCTILTTFGVPCPMCGMTTTFTHLAHLDVVEGALNQPFGVVLFVMTVAVFAIGLSDVVLPRARWRRAIDFVDRHEVRVAGLLLVGMVGGWLYKWARIKDAFPEPP